MTITFSEDDYNDEWFIIDWKASIEDNWNRPLSYIKKYIPSRFRSWESDRKKWIIRKDYFSDYEKLKVEISNKSDLDLEEYLDDMRLVSVFSWNVDDNRELTRLEIKRIALVLRVMCNIIDGETQFSISKNEYGTFSSEEDRWVYSDGTSSSYSPIDKDKKELDNANKYRDKYREHIISWNELREKEILRNKILVKYDYSCYICDKSPETNLLHMHRIISGKDGGEYTEDNVVLVCIGCHKKAEGLSKYELDERRNANLGL